ncbi:MAG: hypothetical protein AAB283_06020 [Planctomycetota bacterium]
MDAVQRAFAKAMEESKGRHRRKETDVVCRLIRHFEEYIFYSKVRTRALAGSGADFI